MVMRGVDGAIVSIASSWFSGVDSAQASAANQTAMPWSAAAKAVCNTQASLATPHRAIFWDPFIAACNSGPHLPKLLSEAIGCPLTSSADSGVGHTWDRWRGLGIPAIRSCIPPIRLLAAAVQCIWCKRRGSRMPWRDGCSSCLSDSRPRRSRPNGTTHCGRMPPGGQSPPAIHHC